LEKDGEEKPEASRDDEEVAPGSKTTAAPATVQVHLPAKARLLIDGAATKQTDPAREFTTHLGAEKQYSCVLLATRGSGIVNN
jgi:hypothetical protein